jgi:CBS domain-containing protein
MATIDQLMTPDPTCCTRDTPVAEVARLLITEDCGLIPVVNSEEERQVLGVVTDRDLVARVMVPGLDPQTTMVEAVMTSEVVTAEPGTSVGAAARQMADAQIRRLLIVEHGGRLAGIVAQADLARAADEDGRLKETLAEVVEEISAPAGAG